MNVTHHALAAKPSATWETRYRYFLGVEWSQVQILSARRSEPALTSVGAGFMLLQFLADVWQWVSSVPRGISTMPAGSNQQPW